MSSITAAVTELNNLHSELKRLRIDMKKLHDRKKVLEKEVIEYINARDQPGIKYQGVTIIPEEKQTFKIKGKKQKEEDVKNLLRRFGVDEENAYSELMTAMKGSPDQKVKLTIKQLR